MNIDELLLAHPMFAESSCVAWGYELIAKWHGKLLPIIATPIQQRYPKGGIGFGGAFDAQFEIEFPSIRVRCVEIEIDDLEALAREQDSKGVPLLCVVFYRATMRYEEQVKPDLDWHTFVAFENRDKIHFVSRRHGSNELISQTIGQLREIHRVAQSVSTDRDRKVVCLLHRLA